MFVGENSVSDCSLMLTMFMQERLIEFCDQQLHVPQFYFRHPDTIEFRQCVYVFSRIGILRISAPKNALQNIYKVKACVTPFGHAVYKTMQSMRDQGHYLVRNINKENYFPWKPSSQFQETASSDSTSTPVADQKLL